MNTSKPKRFRHGGEANAVVKQILLKGSVIKGRDGAEYKRIGYGAPMVRFR